MIRVGLIGCGFMGGMHAACYAALAELGVKVTAIADDRPEFLAQMKEQTDAQTYESGMALIEQADVDVVDACQRICTRRTRARRWKRGAMCSAKSPSV